MGYIAGCMHAYITSFAHILTSCSQHSRQSTVLRTQQHILLRELTVYTIYTFSDRIYSMKSDLLNVNPVQGDQGSGQHPVLNQPHRSVECDPQSSPYSNHPFVSPPQSAHAAPTTALPQPVHDAMGPPSQFNCTPEMMAALSSFLSSYGKEGITSGSSNPSQFHLLSLTLSH